MERVSMCANHIIDELKSTNTVMLIHCSFPCETYSTAAGNTHRAAGDLRPKTDTAANHDRMCIDLVQQLIELCKLAPCKEHNTFRGWTRKYEPPATEDLWKRFEQSVDFVIEIPREGKLGQMPVVRALYDPNVLNETHTMDTTDLEYDSDQTVYDDAYRSGSSSMKTVTADDYPRLAGYHDTRMLARRTDTSYCKYKDLKGVVYPARKNTMLVTSVPMNFRWELGTCTSPYECEYAHFYGVHSQENATNLPADQKNSLPYDLVDCILNQFTAAHPDATNYIVLDVFAGYGSVSGGVRAYATKKNYNKGGKRMDVITNDIVTREMPNDNNKTPDYNEDMSQNASALFTLCQYALLHLEFTNPNATQLSEFYAHFRGHVPPTLSSSTFHPKEIVWYQKDNGPIEKATVVQVDHALGEETSVQVHLLKRNAERSTNVNKLIKYVPSHRAYAYSG